MNVRVRFAKYGAVKFVGHLDVLRYFQKAVRRAGLKIAYSQGFHPHQIMSFASPLGVGITSEGEYMDMELTAEYTPREIVERLNEAMVEGFFVLSCRILPEPESGKKRETAMSLVTAADYTVFLKGNGTAVLGYDRDELKKAWNKFMAQESIFIVKTVKKSNTETTVDLKPFLYESTVESFDGVSSPLSALTAYQTTTEYYALSVVPDFLATLKTNCKKEDGFAVNLRLSAGSANNIKPELVMEAFVRFLGREPASVAWMIHRFDMYTGEKTALKRL